MPSLKKILLITASLFVVACGEKVSTDTVQLSKDFMKALIVMDEKKISEMKHPWAESSLSLQYSLKAQSKALKEYGITLEELTYTVQKGKTDNVECVVVKSNGTRKGNGNLPRVNWRLKFMTDKKKEGLYLEDLYTMYGHFTDKGCRE